MKREQCKGNESFPRREPNEGCSRTGLLNDVKKGRGLQTACCGAASEEKVIWIEDWSEFCSDSSSVGRGYSKAELVADQRTLKRTV